MLIPEGHEAEEDTSGPMGCSAGKAGARPYYPVWNILGCSGQARPNLYPALIVLRVFSEPRIAL